MPNMNEQKILKYKEILLYLIENDDDVKKVLFPKELKNNQNIINSDNEKTGSKSEETIREFETVMSNQAERIRILENQAEIDKNTITSLINDNELLKKRTSSLEVINSIYKDNFQSLFDIYKKYIELGKEITLSFDAIVNTTSPMLFLLSISNSDNLKLFIERLHMEWKKYNESDLRILNQVFDFAFEQFRLINPEYHRIKTNVGEDLNIDKHIRTADSLPVGKITKVIIEGYTNETGTKKVKSYVEVEKE